MIQMNLATKQTHREQTHGGQGAEAEVSRCKSYDTWRAEQQDPPVQHRGLGSGSCGKTIMEKNFFFFFCLFWATPTAYGGSTG